MKVGILVTEDAEHWGGELGIGKFLWRRFSSNDQYNIEFKIFQVVSGTLPEDVESFLGFVISGSHYSVNDELPWMHKLEEFIRNLQLLPLDTRPKLFGICFGHQIIAKALGGSVSQNKHKRFIFGSEDIQLDKEFLKKKYVKAILGTEKHSFRIMQSHGEEVANSPITSVNVGCSVTCENEVLKYGNEILSTQGHPELIEEEMKEKILPQLLIKKKLDEKEMAEALITIPQGETDILVQFVIQFLCSDKL